MPAGDRTHYKRQGISFRGLSGLGVEFNVTRLISSNLTRDHLFAPVDGRDFIGTTRGLRVQLYATSRAATEALVHPSLAGTYTDRDTPARHSIGRLTPSAITFESFHAPHFRSRKRILISAFDLEETRRAANANSVPAVPADGITIDLRDVVTEWVRQVLNELVWGLPVSSGNVVQVDKNGNRHQTQFVLAMQSTFSDLRQYSSRFWMRVYPPLAQIPLGPEWLRLMRNIKHVRRAANDAMDRVPENSAARTIADRYLSLGLPLATARDDAMTSYLAGVDTLRSSILTSLWHTLHPGNERWRHAIAQESAEGGIETAAACVTESLRLSSPGSVFNNRVVRSFTLRVLDRDYVLRRGTRVMPSVHAIHALLGPEFAPDRFLAAGRARPYVMPFGKGPRSCPGKNAGTLLAATFLAGFVAANPHAYAVEIDPTKAQYNTTSNAPFLVSSIAEAE